MAWVSVRKMSLAFKDKHLRSAFNVICKLLCRDCQGVRGGGGVGSHTLGRVCWLRLGSIKFLGFSGMHGDTADREGGSQSHFREVMLAIGLGRNYCPGLSEQECMVRWLIRRWGSLSHFKDGVLGRFRKYSARFFLNKNAW